MAKELKGLMTPLGRPVFLIADGSFVKDLIRFIVRNIGEEINRKEVIQLYYLYTPCLCAMVTIKTFSSFLFI